MERVAASAGLFEAEKFGRARVPDAEEPAGTGVLCGVLKLSSCAIREYQNEGVHVALVETTENEVGPPD